MGLYFCSHESWHVISFGTYVDVVRGNDCKAWDASCQPQSKKDASKDCTGIASRGLRLELSSTANEIAYAVMSQYCVGHNSAHQSQDHRSACKDATQ